MGDRAGSGLPGLVAARARGGLRAARSLIAPHGTARGRALAALRDAGERYPKVTRPGQDLRILVVAPPKSGNMWIKCLLANAYGLAWVAEHRGPQGGGVAEFDAFVARGGFAPGTILHRHYPHSAELVERARAVPCELVTVVRDPYDLFVSYYEHLQSFGVGRERSGAASVVMKGKPLDHPDVLGYLDHDFGRLLRRAVAWVESGDSLVVRYEDLHRDQAATLARLTAQIRPVAPAEIEAAVEACRADRMRQMSGNMAKHVRAATVGDSRQRLGPEHLAIFRERHADAVRRLGYDVR
jgi:Sulfotransferase domain